MNFSRFVIITACKRSLGQGNVFIPVFDSVHRGGGGYNCASFCSQEGLHPATRGGGLHLEGGWLDPPPNRILRDTVNERVVRILLECIFVDGRNLVHRMQQHYISRSVWGRRGWARDKY